ncbi:DivIVA domain-containing protein [Apilactobacillus ozensis]|uniref:Septum site-determining protein divIVA family protein n=1 Tax=Apilactobacillus ozensis DSM 23829 = JCM 17196 TaxID=1423781 RepID=A0A0R2AP66_9LACO|nr:DivIVA domain-containing protein [Apilactobacillus ozensis]KRM68640.1 septum site-determining protein divIVA family protein [Apilactobacillus ozensis DSM 23829 = JCM 17196]MCK8607294.1 DivIVA domain-containing protein [Apilactobacillus ozensis]
MVLSPQDIHNKEFSTKMRGYNIDEVNDFLDQIIKDYQITLEENESLKSKNREVSKELNYFNSMKDSLNQSIIVAQEAADKLKQKSQKEASIANQEAQKKADKILDDANKKANEVLEKASQETKKLIAVNDSLRKSNLTFRNKLNDLLNAQLEFVNKADWENAANNTQESLMSAQNIINELDNSKGSRVNSKDKELSGESLQSTVTFYPDGSFKNN